MSSNQGGSAGGVPKSPGGMGDNKSPFDFDVDFEKVKNRRRLKQQKLQQQQAAANAQQLSEQQKQLQQQEELLLSGMDATDDDVNRPKRTMGGFGGWLGGRQMQANQDGEEDKQEEILYGGKRVTQWPYDEYHLVQQLYYTKLEEIEERKHKDSDEEDEKHTPQQQQQQQQQKGSSLHATTSSSTMYQRPPDPPDIPSAVLGLSLADFEQKAEERAIAIVSTWLFDAGLIDELLVHGGMSQATMMTASTDKDGSPTISAAAGADDKAANGAGQGIEIGVHGFPIEGASKMDKEILKLKTSTQRQLALINARLNDGVAASGGEVQELVHAVTAVKTDLGRLRELGTYISNAGDNGERSSKFLLTRYPKLKKAINARRNLARCFRELDFYSQIPVTCDQLREELHSGEWTEHEWSTIRDVCREHVELEIFLVEAEAGMKKRVDEEAQERAAQEQEKHVPTRESRFSRSTFKQAGLPHNYEEVDNFLREHVKNVWELGDEIRLRIMSGIGSAFELAMNNPAGMVALVESVEVYETANEEYKTVHGQEAGTQGQTSLRFTDMRASALKQIYQDFELRGYEVFREVTANAEIDEESEAATSNAVFNAILRAANGLTSEIVFVQNQMAPCFPPHWAVETLWCTCVAHICAKQILDQIGGREGHKLDDFTVTQLLDLVAWVENFRETIEETFPNIGQHTSKKTYFDERPQLLMENSKSINMEVAKDSLAWANNMLWEVHDLAKDEFLYRTKLQTDEWLDNVYSADHTKNQTSDGRLLTSLCEDVYSLAGVQLRTIRERLTRRSEALVQAVGVIFKNLFDKQTTSRDSFLVDLETCCAAANDFIRMSEKCEEILAEMQEECNLSPEANEALEEQSAILLGLYSADAVYACQKLHQYIFEPIEEAIAEELFGEEWLNNLTHNELALTLVRTLEDFMGDLEIYLDELMVTKSVEALVTGTVIFYIKFMMRKSTNHKDGKKSAFSDNYLALKRMMGDIRTFKEYFDKLAKSYPSLSRIIDNEFEILESFHEVLSIAAGVSQSSARDFVLVLQKRIRNIPITKFVMGDLYHLINPVDERKIYDLVDSMEEELKTIAPNDEKAFEMAQDRKTVPGLRVDQVLAKLVDESKRKRPIKGNTLEQTEIMLSRWRQTWVNTLDKEAS